MGSSKKISNFVSKMHKMIKYSWVFFLFLVTVGCGETNHENFVEQPDGTYMSVKEVNDSIIERKVLNTNKVLSSVEYENIKSNDIKIYYYDENKSLYQSLMFNTSDILYLNLSLSRQHFGIHIC